jgi:hypothetical protein
MVASIWEKLDVTMFRVEPFLFRQNYLLFSGLFDSVPRRQNKRKLSSSRGPFHKKKKESLKYGTNAEMNPTIQNKFLKGKQKFARDGAVQKNKFHKRKVFGSKISKKNKP